MNVENEQAAMFTDIRTHFIIHFCYCLLLVTNVCVFCFWGTHSLSLAEAHVSVRLSCLC